MNQPGSCKLRETVSPEKIGLRRDSSELRCSELTSPVGRIGRRRWVGGGIWEISGFDAWRKPGLVLSHPGLRMRMNLPDL